MKKGNPEESLATQIYSFELPTPMRQYRMPEYPKRLWRFDFAFIEQRLLIDVQGGIWVDHLGHSSGSGISKDCEKYNAATLAGYRLLLVTGNMIKDGTALNIIEQALNGGRQANSVTHVEPEQLPAVEGREE